MGIDADHAELESNPVTITTTLLLATAAILIYFLYTKFWSAERWEKYGVKQASIGIQELPTVMIQRLMDEYGPTVGIWRGSPALVTRDLDLLKQVTIKDFNNFVNRSDTFPTKCSIGKGLFFLRDYDWKRIRQLMSPSFSTGKLKRISAHVHEAARSLAASFETCARNGLRSRLLHTTGQYTTSIIAKTAFGLQANCIGEEEDDEFTLRAKDIFKVRGKWGIRIVLVFMRFRWLRDLLINYLSVEYLDPVPSKTRKYFNAVLEEAVRQREEAELKGEGRKHNDFLQSLVSTKVATDAAREQSKMGENKGERKLENGHANGHVGEASRRVTTKTITKEEVIGQSVLTILAAFETTASTLHFCLLKLAQNPDIQDKVYAEIRDEILHHHNQDEGDLNPSHEDLARLTYTEQVINETLRLFPPVTAISRLAYNTWTYGGITVPAGAGIIIPIRSIQRDPAHWPDPDRFDPDRFTEEAKANRHPLAFMPFGQGPRLCIGMRLAYLELKAGLVHLLRKVKVELNETTVPKKGEDIKLTFQSFPRPEDPVELAVKLREDDS